MSLVTSSARSTGTSAGGGLPSTTRTSLRGRHTTRSPAYEEIIPPADGVRALILFLQGGFVGAHGGHDGGALGGGERGQHLGPGGGAAGEPLRDRGGVVRGDRDDPATAVGVVLGPG